jgi:hypothetical protein
MGATNGRGALRCVDSENAPKPVGWRARHGFNKSENPQTQALRAELAGSDQCAAAGITARGAAPVLRLCRLLIAAGHDPRRRLEVYRGAVLALRVRSIGEAAALEINSKGTRFVAARPVRTASPARFSGLALSDQRAGVALDAIAREHR